MNAIKRLIHHCETILDIHTEETTEAAAELAALVVESEGRRLTLIQKSEELRREWIRAEQAEAKNAVLTSELTSLRDAVKFYAKRYHDEHHQGETYLNCMAETCQAAAALNTSQK